MDGKRELGIRVRRFFVPSALFQPFAGAAEAGAEREVLIGITEGAEQAANFVGALASSADNAQGGGDLGLACVDALKQDTFKLSAVLRTLGVNAALTAIVRGARLRQVRWAQRRLGCANRQAQRPQPGGLFVPPQADVGKNNAVAAEPAGGAKLGGAHVVGIRRAVQAACKLRPNPFQGNAEHILVLPAGEFSCKVWTHLPKGQLYERTA